MYEATKSGLEKTGQALSAATDTAAKKKQEWMRRNANKGNDNTDYGQEMGDGGEFGYMNESGNTGLPPSVNIYNQPREETKGGFDPLGGKSMTSGNSLTDPLGGMSLGGQPVFTAQKKEPAQDWQVIDPLNPLGAPVSKPIDPMNPLGGGMPQAVPVIKKEAPLEPLLPLPESHKNEFIQRLCEQTAMKPDTIDNFNGSRAQKKKLIAWRNKAVKLID